MLVKFYLEIFTRSNVRKSESSNSGAGAGFNSEYECESGNCCSFVDELMVLKIDSALSSRFGRHYSPGNGKWLNWKVSGRLCILLPDRTVNFWSNKQNRV